MQDKKRDSDCSIGTKRAESRKQTGAEERSRTSDLLITNQLLYQLSYFGVAAKYSPEI